jgi:DNA-binding IclR family transcriptional regulator
MLREMERDVGLQDLTVPEMDVFLAASALAGDEGEAVTSDQIHHHDLTSGLAQATYHRALKSLLNLGLLETAEGYKTRRYVVRTDLVGK